MISLMKGTKSDVVDSNGQPANEVDFSAVWRAAKQGGKGLIRKGAQKVDLDLTLICFRADKQPVAVCSDDSKEPFPGQALRHLGDKKSDRSGDEQHETIEAILNTVPPQMEYLAVVTTSFKGHTLDSVNQFRLVITDRKTGAEIATHYIPIMGAETAVIMAVLQRNGTSGWTIVPDDYTFSGGKDWRSVAAEVIGKLP